MMPYKQSILIASDYHWCQMHTNQYYFSNPQKPPLSIDAEDNTRALCPSTIHAPQTLSITHTDSFSINEQ